MYADLIGREVDVPASIFDIQARPDRPLCSHTLCGLPVTLVRHDAGRGAHCSSCLASSLPVACCSTAAPVFEHIFGTHKCSRKA